MKSNVQFQNKVDSIKMADFRYVYVIQHQSCQKTQTIATLWWLTYTLKLKNKFDAEDCTIKANKTYKNI